MKKLIIWKRVDWWGQLLSLVLPWSYYYIFHRTAYSLPEQVIASYFFMGAIQVVSCLANKFALPASWQMPDRTGYEIILAIIAIAVSFAFVAKNMAPGMMVVMLYVSPAMAIWYGAITLRELLKIKRWAKQQYL